MVTVEVARPPSRASHLDDLRPGGSSLDPVYKDARNGIPDALLVVATGVLLVALAYARARGSLGFATPLFWTGQVLTFAFVVFRVLNPSTSPRDREFLVVLYAGAQSMIRWAYSPDMFTWFDELQHLRSLLTVLTTHHLFHTNFSLPVSPRYPGLENVTAELAQVSSAGPFVAGVIIAGVSHLLLAACILLLFREVSQSSRVACIGVTVYMLSPQVHYFDTSFVYETVALPFLALSIFFSIRFAIHQGGRYQSFVGLLACVAIVVMTHHLSALATVGLLASIALATSLFRGSRNLALPLAICAASGALIVGYWMSFVAPTTRGYLSGAGEQILNGLIELGQVEGKSKLPGPSIPIFDRVFTTGGVVLTLVLLAASVRFARSRRPLELSFIWVALGSYAVVIAIRVLAADGAELSIRLLTYVSLFTALAVALLLDRLASNALSRHRRPACMYAGLVSATAIAIVLLLASITTGVPAWWQRLPGSFRVDGSASGIDAIGTSRAEWAATYLQPGSRYFGDSTSVSLLATLAQLDPIQAPESLYYTDRLTPENAALINAQSATYVDVDMRMSEDVPITGSYFPVDIKAGDRETPIDEVDLDKFDVIPGISRIYDSGDDHFFDLRRVQGIYGN
ncbi:MAG: hypothetical protein JWR37_3190 [Mycobacterium sp.]|nr:hypothetical protein [Mycobacterium sp.]